MTTPPGPRAFWRTRGMTLEALVSFLAVVEFGGFGRAAEALHRSQSRVSTHVAELERSLGASLFDRRTRPTTLTDTGEAFAEHVREALGRLETGAEHVQALIDIEEGEVRIGSYASPSVGFLPAIIASFTTAHPRVRVTLYESDVSELEQLLLEGEVGLAIRPVQPERLHPDIASISLWREDLHLVVPEDDAVEAFDVPLDEEALTRLLSGRVVSVGNPRRRGQMTTNAFDTDVLLRRVGVDLSHVVYTQHPQAAVAMVRAGVGVGLVNGLALATSDISAVAHRPVLEEEIHRDVALCWNRRRYHSAAERRLMRLVRDAPPPSGTRALPVGPEPDHPAPTE